MNVRNALSYIPLSSINSATFTGAYQIVNNNVSAPCFAFKIMNGSSVDITLSLDGVTDHDFIPANTGQVYDLQTNKQPNGDTCLLPQGSKIFVKGSVSTGLVYFVGLTQIKGI